MRPRPNLLMLSYFYPPAATGVRRVLSLARHLPAHGWHPLVLTVGRVRGAGHDPAPLDDPVIEAIPRVETGSLDPYRLLEILRPSQAGGEEGSLGGKSPEGSQRLMNWLRRFVFWPDDRMGWIPFAVLRGIALVRRHRIRAVYSSNYPQSAHAAAALIQMAAGVPWLADFRDGWTQNPAFHQPGNALMAWAQRAGERWTARHADAIVTVSPPITRHLQAMRPARMLPARTIYNGFDEAEIPVPTPDARPLQEGRRTLLYTGTFFGRRKPDLFFAALAHAVRRDPTITGRWRVRMRCPLGERERGVIRRLGIEEAVEFLPAIPFRDCLAEQARADACLLVLETGPGAEIMVSQKVFEYLAGRRPIFALLPEGAAAELLRET
ncbi:glycosyltransferase, partial [Candidatus Poribacteria bacterium]|nr:glycosyltransferase [Candidatus Poribacteria bacterium]